MDPGRTARSCMNEPAFDLETAHRFFAAAMNNQAWDLLESPARSSEQDELMRTTAYAAARHWSEVGQAINHPPASRMPAGAGACCVGRGLRGGLPCPAGAGVDDRSGRLNRGLRSGVHSRRGLTSVSAGRRASPGGLAPGPGRESARASITDAADREVVEAWLVGRDETA